MRTVIITVLLALAPLTAESAVRFNPVTGYWEGNICANQLAWTWIPWQPVGTFCVLRLANGQRVQGIVLNQ